MANDSVTNATSQPTHEVLTNTAIGFHVKKPEIKYERVSPAINKINSSVSSLGDVALQMKKEEGIIIIWKVI